MSQFANQKPEDSLAFTLGQGDIRLQPNFMLREFGCNDGSWAVLVHPRLADLLQRARDHFGQAVHINSGYRTAAHNEDIGGHHNSRHMYGMAADIVVKTVSPSLVADYAEAEGAGGVGRYGTFTHVDVWKHDRRWNG